MKKVTLLWASAQHAKDIADIYASIVRDTAISFEIEVPSVEVMMQRIESVGSQNPYLVAMIDDTVAGYAYSADFRTRKAYRFTKEATVYVHEQFRKQGVASLLYEKLFDILKLQGAVKVMAVITIPNDKSVLFHEKMGFSLTGTISDAGYKFDRFWDVSFYEKTIPENRVPRPLLKDWKEVKKQFPELIG